MPRSHLYATALAVADTPGIVGGMAAGVGAPPANTGHKRASGPAQPAPCGMGATEVFVS